MFGGNVFFVFVIFFFGGPPTANTSCVLGTNSLQGRLGQAFGASPQAASCLRILVG
jgi:hypothetical protein